MQHTRAPQGTNRIAWGVAKCMRAVREKRCINDTAAADNLGISIRYYRLIEAGRHVPPPWLAKRIYNWSKTGKTYSNRGRPNAKQRLKYRRLLSQIKEIWVPKKVRLQLQWEADSLGLTIQELLIVICKWWTSQEGKPLRALGNSLEYLRITEAHRMLQEVPEYGIWFSEFIENAQKLGAEVEDVVIEKPKKLPIKETERFLGWNNGPEWEIV